jgi:hypothetical protein
MHESGFFSHRVDSMRLPCLDAIGDEADMTPTSRAGRSGATDPQRHRRANFAVMHNAALDPANLTTGVSQGVCCRSSTKVMVNGWPAMVFPSASVNGKDAHRLSVCATAMRYDERSAFDASLD